MCGSARKGSLVWDAGNANFALTGGAGCINGCDLVRTQGAAIHRNLIKVAFKLVVPIGLSGRPEIERKITVVLLERYVRLAFENAVDVDLSKIRAANGCDMIPDSSADGGGGMNVGSLRRGGGDKKAENVASTNSGLAEIESLEI